MEPSLRISLSILCPSIPQGLVLEPRVQQPLKSLKGLGLCGINSYDSLKIDILSTTIIFLFRGLFFFNFRIVIEFDDSCCVAFFKLRCFLG